MEGDCRAIQSPDYRVHFKEISAIISWSDAQQSQSSLDDAKSQESVVTGTTFIRFEVASVLVTV